MKDKNELKKVLNEIYERNTLDSFLTQTKIMRRKLNGLYNVSKNDFDVLVESILDPVNKERCEDIFDSKENMKKGVRKFIMDIIEKFQKEADEVTEDLIIDKVYFIGSSTGFQYTVTSDIDIQILIKKNFRRALSKVFNFIPKGEYLPGTKRPINIFLVETDKFDPDKCENIYEVREDKWIKKTDHAGIEVPYAYISELSRFFMDACDLTISKYLRNKQEYEEYLSLDPETQEISEREKIQALDRKVTDIRNDHDALRLAHRLIFSFEKQGYEGFPFRISIDMIKTKDPRYSVNNLVYKMIDKFGYIDKLKQYEEESKEIIKNSEERIEKEIKDERI